MQDPEKETWAFFETMKGETQRAAQMYSQFHIIKEIDRFVNGWSTLDASVKKELLLRITQWLDNFDEIYQSLTREESCKRRFEFAHELNKFADKVLNDGQPSLDDLSAQLGNVRMTLLNGILGAIDYCIEDVSNKGCPYALHSTSFEVARLVANYEIQRCGPGSCDRESAILEAIELLRNRSV